MYTLRLTRTLLTDFDSPDAGDRHEPQPTTRLGDWYVMPLQVGRRALVLCSSSRSRLTIVLPRPDMRDLPEQLGVALVPVLRALDVSEDAIGAELDEMVIGRIGPALDRTMAGTMRAQGRRARDFIESGRAAPVDVGRLHRLLWVQRTRASGRQTIGELTASLFRA